MTAFVPESVDGFMFLYSSFCQSSSSLIFLREAFLVIILMTSPPLPGMSFTR